jgi:enoyl-CoA hydratase/carnithine racemase
VPEAIELQREEAVAVVRLNRPERRNALSPAVLEELAQAIGDLDADEGVRCIVVTGTDEVFAAGADIKAMVERSFQQVLEASTMPFWQRVADCRTPLVAGVSGFALGGGCELALLCDMIVASETAEFGQPEITLGIIPGGGGTQRLARVIGKQRTMELVLTGRRIAATEALRLGFVNMVASKRTWFRETVDLAHVIARRPPLAVKLAKQAVLAADEMPLTAGLAHERRLYELAMATEDRVEGMRAFLEKRRPKFEGR